MLSNASISWLIWDKIFWWEPNLEQEQDYLVLNIVWERNTEVNKQTRIEFRLNWHNQETTFATLMNIRKEIINQIVNERNFWTFENYWVVEHNSLANWIWEKNRKIVVFDISFYFIN